MVDNFEEELEINIPSMDFEDIETIVNNGVKKKIPFINYLKTSVKELGFENIFHDKNELMVIGLAGIMLIVFSLYSVSYDNLQSLYKFIFIVSPILYFSVVAFSFYNSKDKGAFDLEMTCKYNLFHLTALRMFTFSVANILINSLIIIGLWVFKEQVDVIRLIIISITGVFLFSTVFLYSMIKIRWRSAKYIVMAVWVGGNLILSSVESKLYFKFLMKAPIYIHLIISVVCLILYVKNLGKLINYRDRRGEI